MNYKGIPAFVERANTLSQERFEGAWTLPANAFYEHHGHLFPEYKTPPTPPAPDEPPTQLRLF